MHRRHFLTAVAASAAAALPAPASAIAPIKRTGQSRMKLSLAAYSFRAALAGAKKSMTLDDFVDLASTYDIDAVEPTSYYFPEPPTPEYCRSLRRHALLQGLAISGTAVRNTFTYAPGPQLDKEIDHVKRWIDLAAELHAPTIRIFAGDLQKGTSESDARKWCVDAIHRACEHAATRGIILALENHGGIVSTADQLLAIVRDVKSDWFGVNLDTGNFHGPDPYADLARVAPYAVVVQIKTEISAGKGSNQPADLARKIKILRDAKYRGFVALEYEAEGDPRQAMRKYLAQLKELIG
ncbi:MAG: sugar phosphate isomerase/epimerase family protein [Vicinamibacterales bacterium]